MMETISLDTSNRNRLTEDEKYRAEDEKDYDASVIESLSDSIKRISVLNNIENVALSQDCRNGTSGVPAIILSEILRFELQDYYKEVLVERYSFFRRQSPEKIMKWQSKEISKPLTKLTKHVEVIALQLFKNLLSYCWDRKSTKKPIEHVKKYLKLTMFANQELRDESYVQVLKQLKENPDHVKELRVWSFFAIISSCYAPSQKLLYSIMNYLFFEIKNNKDEKITHYANYIFLRLYKISEQKRVQIPSETELIHIENLKPIVIQVHFFNETSAISEIESYTTVREVKTMIMKKLQFNITKIPYYSLYEVCNRKETVEERFLEDGEKLCDMLSLWDKEKNEATNKQPEPEPIEFRIYLKIFLYFPYSEIDVDTITVVYTQTTYDVATGKYALKEQEIITLAAIQLLVEFSTNQYEAHRSLQKNLDKFIPLNQFNLNPRDYWIQKIMELYSGLKASSKLEAKLTYIEQLKTSNLWEAHQFDVKLSAKSIENPENLPENLIMGIKPDGIALFDEDRNQLLFYEYHIINNWGISEKLLILNVQKSEGANMIKYYFQINSSKIIQALLECYTSLIAGKTINEIQNIITDYPKRFNSLQTGRTRSGTNYGRSTFLK